jgi:hypothetical protein
VDVDAAVRAAIGRPPGRIGLEALSRSVPPGAASDHLAI